MAEFEMYHPDHPEYPLYPSDISPSIRRSHIRFNEVHKDGSTETEPDILITNAVFNHTGSHNFDNIMVGIESYASSFTVRSSTFNDLFTGIQANPTFGENSLIDVDNRIWIGVDGNNTEPEANANHFNRNNYGVYSMGTGLLDIWGNSFKGHDSYFYSIGMYIDAIDNATDLFHIYGNNLDWCDEAIITRNTGDPGNEFNNKIIDNYIREGIGAVTAMGSNDGVIIGCNDMNDMNFDITVTNSPAFGGAEIQGTVAEHQAMKYNESLGQVEEIAGNLFTDHEKCIKFHVCDSNGDYIITPNEAVSDTHISNTNEQEAGKQFFYHYTSQFGQRHVPRCIEDETEDGNPTNKCKVNVQTVEMLQPLTNCDYEPVQDAPSPYLEYNCESGNKLDCLVAMEQQEISLKQDLTNATNPQQQETLTIQLAGLQQTMKQAFFSILKDHTDISDWQSAIYFVQQHDIEDIRESELLLELYLHQGNVATALQTLQNLSPIGLHSSTFKDYWTLRLALYQSGRNWTDMTPQETNELQVIANSPTILAVKAQKILQYISGNTYIPPMPIRPATASKRSLANNREQSNVLQLIPNPNRGQATLYLPETWLAEMGGQIQILDINGRLLQKYDCPKDNKALDIDTNSLENGLYLCILVQNGKTLSHVKMSIIK